MPRIADIKLIVLSYQEIIPEIRIQPLRARGTFLKARRLYSLSLVKNRSSIRAVAPRRRAVGAKTLTLTRAGIGALNV